jgi:hypothetical protein
MGHREAEEKTGAAERIRTSDPRITNAVLYRLSYRGLLEFSHVEAGIATGLPPARPDFCSHSVRTLAKAASIISAARVSVFLNMCP